MNVLIISYYFTPDKRVGALRTSYWFNNLSKVMDCNIEVLTSNTESQGKGVHIIPKTGSFSKFSLVKDEGLLWKNNVSDYLRLNKINKPDVVIITGSPFMHFSLIKTLKQKYNCKVILDYRDPFSNNPAFNNSWFKILIKKLVERRLNKDADAIITVNEYCGDLIQLFDKKKNAIIENGYDDNIQPKLKEINLDNPIFSYPGKFYLDPAPLIQVLSKYNYKLHYAGSDEFKLDLSNSTITSFGFVDYAKSVEIIANSDIGVIMINASKFQSTTKIYDYIRCKKIILIIASHELGEGSIADILKGYPNVYWTKNDAESIEKCIFEIQKNKYNLPESILVEKFSRNYQMRKLADLIKQLIQ